MQPKRCKVMKKSREKLPETIPCIDRISNLPDAVLCHMLSFLPTKELAGTSILSRRWEGLWTYVDILDFDYSLIGNQFEQFVHRFMQLHRAPRIKRMRLHCCGKDWFSTGTGCNEYDVVTWIRTAVSRNVERLDVSFYKLNVMWPPCLFYSQTLVELKVEFAHIYMNIPTAPFFPNLKKLHLERTNFETDSLRCLISGCSSLVYLDLKLEYNFVGLCNISSATLHTFHFSGTPAFGGKGKLVVDTPALEFLQIITMRMLEVVVENRMLSLHEAHVYICGHEIRYNPSPAAMVSFLGLLSDVVTLRLDTLFSASMKPVESNLHAHFHNLTKLDIIAPQFGLNLLKNFMEKSNNLKVITLENVYQHPYNQKSVIKWEEPRHVPKCLLSSLRTVCIKAYEYEKEVGLMIKYVLGNAQILESMELHASFPEEENDCKLLFHMLRKISMFPRASEICELSFL